MNVANRLMLLLLVCAMSLVAGAQQGMAAPHGGRAIEICAEDSVTLIYVDADGQQLPAEPICDCAACQHCCVPALALLPGAPDLGTGLRPASPADFKPASFGLKLSHRTARLARGPPAPKAMT